MLRFFRQIRKNLMEQNKVRSYFFYAIGEITLVMIGILLALQVNNWNEQVTLEKQEKSILTSLQYENVANSSILKECIKELKEDIAVGDFLQQYLGPEYAGIEKDSLNIMMGKLGGTSRCQIETDVIDELRSSGNLKLIQNQNLRRAISKWSTLYIELKEEEKDLADQFSTQYLVYTNDWVSWDDVDLLVGNIETTFTGTSFEYDVNKMLQEFEYANQLNNLRWRMRRVTSRLENSLDQLIATDSLLMMELN